MAPEISMESEPNRFRWYAIHAKSRYENFVATQLRGKGFEPFLPIYESRRKWSQRIKTIEIPLFPGYLFCRFNANDRLPIVITPGVIRVVGFGKNPVPVDDQEIAGIQTIVSSGLARQPWPFLQCGQKVRVECGPLHGLDGILVSTKGHHRLVLSVTILQRSVSVEVDDSWVRPVAPSLPASPFAISHCASS